MHSNVHRHQAMQSDMHTQGYHTCTGIETHLYPPLHLPTQHRDSDLHTDPAKIQSHKHMHTDAPRCQLQLGGWLVLRPNYVRGTVLISLHALSHLTPTLALGGTDDDYPHFIAEETEVKRGVGTWPLQEIVELSLRLRAVCLPGLGSQPLYPPAS